MNPGRPPRFDVSREGEGIVVALDGDWTLAAGIPDAGPVLRELEDGAGHGIRYRSDGLGVVFHAVEHMSYHTGQILYLAKQVRGAGHGIELYPQHRGE